MLKSYLGFHHYGIRSRSFVTQSLVEKLKQPNDLESTNADAYGLDSQTFISRGKSKFF